jgi:hypothetical protein
MDEANGSAEAYASQTGRRPVGGPLAVAAVTLGLVTWPIAFNLGAYGEIFYDDIFRVVVASSILFVIVAVNPPYSAPAIWIVRAALALPLLWVLVSGYVVGSTSEAMTRPVFVAWLVLVAVVSVPITLRLLVDLFTPDVSRTGSRRLTVSIVLLVAAVAAIGFTAGWQNPRFMTCADFAVAGSSEPENCARTTG